MNRKFEEVLENCIAEIKNGQTLEGCLLAYPEFADRLAPLLKTAFLLSSALPEVSPSLDFEEETEAKLLAAVRAKRVETPKGKVLPFQKRWAIAPTFAKVAAAALVCFMLTGGIVAASANSLPNSPLYVVKKSMEKIQLALTFNEEAKVELYLTFAHKRLDEAESLKEKNQDGEILKLCMKDMQKNIDEAQVLAENISTLAQKDLATKIDELANEHDMILAGVFPKLPAGESDSEEELAMISKAADEEELAADSSSISEDESTLQASSATTSMVQETGTLKPVWVKSPAPLKINSLFVDLGAISPNGDGVNEAVVITLNMVGDQTPGIDVFKDNNLVCSSLSLKEIDSSGDKKGTKTYSAVWDGRDNQGETVVDGSYIIKIRDEKGSHFYLTAIIIVDTEAPVFALINPSIGELLNSYPLRLIWQQVPDVADYTVECSQEPYFKEDVTFKVSNLTETSYIIRGYCRIGTGLIYWRVTCTDRAGNIGCTRTGWFIIENN